MKILKPVLAVTNLLNPQDPSKTNELSRPILPIDHPASIQFNAWLSAFNTADKETLLNYHSDTNFPYSATKGWLSNVEGELELSKILESLHIADVDDASKPNWVVVTLTGSDRSPYFRATMEVDTSSPRFTVTDFDIHPIATPLRFIPEDDPRRPQFEKALRPLTAGKRTAVVDGLSAVLRDQYADPKAVEDIITILQTHLKSGAYDNYQDSWDFAVRLSIDMGAQSDVNVLFVEPRRNISDEMRKPQNHLEHLRQLNFGFGTVSYDTQTIPGQNIATLPINYFPPSDPNFAMDWQEIRKEIGNILGTISNADALLVDLRRNYGGDPSTVAFVLSYFLDNAPLHTLDFVDRSGKVEQSFYTTAADELPEETLRFGGTKPLFVLTRNVTNGAAEDMAYTLQAFQRSIATIGEGNDATAGGAKLVTEPRYICEDIFGEGWWMALVPRVTPVHAITGSNWDKVGVKSDIVAGKGEWEGVSDAEEVGRRLASLVLAQRTEL